MTRSSSIGKLLQNMNECSESAIKPLGVDLMKEWPLDYSCYLLRPQNYCLALLETWTHIGPTPRKKKTWTSSMAC